MRFKKPEEYCERGFTYRDKTFFAWFPVCIDGEMRWLETVTVKQVYTEVYSIGCAYNKEYVWGWTNCNFVENL
jgi:hypothetical protein